MAWITFLSPCCMTEFLWNIVGSAILSSALKSEKDAAGFCRLFT